MRDEMSKNMKIIKNRLARDPYVLTSLGTLTAFFLVNHYRLESKKDIKNSDPLIKSLEEE